MNILASFNMIFKRIKNIISNNHGIFNYRHSLQLPIEMHDYEREVLSDLKMKPMSDDKANLKRDVNTVKAGFRKATDEYRFECVNG